MAAAVTKQTSLTGTIGLSPTEAYSQLRDAGAVAWDPEVNAWIASSYDACREVFTRDNEAFRHQYQEFRGTPLGDLLGARHLAILSGPDHTRLHQWFLRLFSPKTVDGWRETIIRPVINERIDRFVVRGSAELFSELANPLPPTVIASIMGLPTDDAWILRIKHLISTVFAGFPESFAATEGSLDGIFDSPRFKASMAAAAEAVGMLRPFIEERRSGEGSDPISLLWRDGREMFADWDVADVTALCRQMFSAGSDTTSQGLAAAFRLLLDHPMLVEEIHTGNDRTVAAIVEEALRLHGPTVFRGRVANCPVELGGASIKTNDVVIAHQAAANRDPNHYEHADEIDLERKAPRDHMAFVFGPRTCVGAALARAELQEALRLVAQRLPGLRWDPQAEIPALVTTSIRRDKNLPVVFDV
jgi:cytochrome P450